MFDHTARLFLVACTLAVTIPDVAVADLVAGYVQGGPSQLLAANGGSGTTLFVDSARLGGDDVFQASGTASFNSVLLNGSGFWSAGDTVSISGVALTLIGGTNSGRTKTGTFTFDIREGIGGTGASGAAGLSSLGTRTASYVQPAGTSVAEVRFVNFDTPLTFVADANSTTIGINFTSTDSIGYKSTTSADGLARYNFANGNLVGNNQWFSVAGSVAAIPEPSAALFGCLVACGYTLSGRRRR